MSNLLASYFTNSGNDITNNTSTTDIAGRSFFDIISDCKDFNEEQVECIENSNLEIWPYPDSVKASNSSFKFAISEPLVDPIRILINKYFGAAEAAKRVLPNADSVVPDANGLQILIKCGCFRSVVNLTYKILSSLPNEELYTSFSLQIWFIRISILLKTKFFKEAEMELKQFDNFEKAEFFYQTKQPGQIGTFVPFGLRILNAELAHYMGNSNESVSNLYKILSIVKKILLDLPQDSVARKVWNERKNKILFSISNILISRKNYSKAMEILKSIAESEYADKNAVWSSIGKLYATLGDALNASNSFKKAKAFSKENPSNKCRNLLNLSFLKIINHQYKEAFDYLQEADQLAPHNSTILNNMAFCLFYSGNLIEAIKLIESKIHLNPAKYLNESLLFNLCTLYELESSKALQKKQNLLFWLNVYAGDGFNETCLQLQ
ncbi:trafficking particle complex subunit 12-like [Brachionus plicatilis]|uniref:Trafficking particle complex subunit 12-like n=1 Tax=Brachionus plicatilis TaxID=10195 RepID=A0A3M7RCS7_BRAPC|nr:trafficking particle complex subunit 12-like [Brachionus plicatilis]